MFEKIHRVLHAVLHPVLHAGVQMTLYSIKKSLSEEDSTGELETPSVATCDGNSNKAAMVRVCPQDADAAGAAQSLALTKIGDVSSVESGKV